MNAEEFRLRYTASDPTEALVADVPLDAVRGANWMIRLEDNEIRCHERWLAWGFDTKEHPKVKAARLAYAAVFKEINPISDFEFKPWPFPEFEGQNPYEVSSSIVATEGTAARIEASGGGDSYSVRLGIPLGTWRIVAAYQFFLAHQVTKLSRKGALRV